MAQMLPYILPLILGRTFDLDKMKVGVDIFPANVLDRKETIQNPVTETHYKVVDNSHEARDLLDVSGSFSLNVKGGMFQAGASGEYLSDTYNRENTVEIAVKATYQTVTEQLPIDAVPVDTFRKLGSAVGTHFVRSITYGGELIASVRLITNNTRDKMKIKGAVDVGGRVEIFDVGLQVEGEYMNDVAKTIENTQIKVFSSVPLSKPPNDIKSLNETLQKFPDDLQLFHGGKGMPIKMELWPLSFFDKQPDSKIRDKILEVTLDEFEEKFDDLVNTKTAIANWLKSMSKPLTADQESTVGKLYKEVQDTIQEFYKVIGELDLTKGTSQLDDAQKAYKSGIPGHFYRKYQLCRQKIAKDQGDWTLSRGNGVTYYHWGKKTCPNMTELLCEGVAVGPQGFGGGANLMCLPMKNPSLGPIPENTRDASALQGVYFHNPDDDVAHQLYCASCRLGARGSVQVFSGRTSCPEEWDYLYDGLLMSGMGDIMISSFVCLDRKPEKDAQAQTANAVIPNWVFMAGQTSSDGSQIRKIVPCVVCAK